MKKTYMRNPNLPVTNWRVAIDALPGKIGVSDMDGVIERRGYFLWLEAKNINEAMTRGQEILLERLAEIPKHSVMLVRMDSKTGDIFGYSRFLKGKWKPFDCDNKGFAKLIKGWYKMANRRK